MDRGKSSKTHGAGPATQAPIIHGEGPATHGEGPKTHGAGPLTQGEGPAGLWRDVAKAWTICCWHRLLRKREAKRTVFKLVLSGIAGVFALLGLSAAVISPMIGLRGQPAALDGYIVLVSLLAGAFLLYLQLIVGYQRLVASDSSLLLVSPLTGRTILMARLFESGFGALMYVGLALPFTIGYLVVTHAHWYDYPVAVIAVLLTVASIVSLAFFLITLLLHVLKRRVGKEVFGVLSSVIAIVALVVPRVLARNAESGMATSGAFAKWLQPQYAFIPFAWFGHALSGLVREFGVGLGYTAMLLVWTALLLVVSFALGAPVLHERLTRLADGPGFRRTSRKSDGVDHSRSARTHRPRSANGAQVGCGARTDGGAQVATDTRGQSHRIVAWEIARKDLLRLRRTPSELANYLFPTAYLIFIMAEQGRGTSIASTVGLLPFFILILAGTMGRVPISSFGTEGDGVWLYLLSPAPSASVVRAKWLFGTLPTLLWWELLCVLMTAFGSIPAGVAWLLGISGLWLIPGAVALTLPFAVNGAAFRPRQVGRRTTYANRSSGWYMIVVFPYLLLQIVPLGVASVYVLPPLTDAGSIGLFLAHVHAGAQWLWVAVLVSLALGVLGSYIGHSMAVEAWKNKRLALYESGSLEA